MKYFKDEKNKKTLFIYSLIGIIIISFYFALLRFDTLKNIFDLLISIIMPFIVGMVLAFLLKSPMNFTEFILLKNIKMKQSHKHKLAVFGALAFGFFVIVVFLLMLLPQLYESLLTLALNISDYYANIENVINYIEQTFNLDFGIIFEQLVALIPPMEELTTIIMNTVSTLLPNVFSITVSITNNFIKIVVGVIICTYILVDIDGICHEYKRILYAFLDNAKADRVVFVTDLVNRVFNNFIGGKIVDSLIIGILCYIGMSIFKMPYPLLISVIIGITNVVPFFGPFIGAVPGAIIVLVAQPSQFIWFILFILLLQQFDGNILGPYILGDSVGLPSIWVMFAILVGGGLFDLLGMIIGVPTFAVFYYLFKENLENKLKAKQKKLQMEDAGINSNIE